MMSVSMAKPTSRPAPTSAARTGAESHPIASSRGWIRLEVRLAEANDTASSGVTRRRSSRWRALALTKVLGSGGAPKITCIELLAPRTALSVE